MAMRCEFVLQAVVASDSVISVVELLSAHRSTALGGARRYDDAEGKAWKHRRRAVKVSSMMIHMIAASRDLIGMLLPGPWSPTT